MRKNLTGVKNFELYPAIDLRRGQVVRLRKGDPDRQTTYTLSPAQAAQRWLAQGARWLHVVNLDGAFGESGAANSRALTEILAVAQEAGAQVQFGGGVRSMETVEAVLEAGVSRVVLGTVLVEQKGLFGQAVERWGPERLAAGVDARRGVVQVRGWAVGSGIKALELAGRLAQEGARWLVYTDIARDGTGAGANLAETAALANECGLQVIASGGFDRLEEITTAKKLGLAGAILGRALYEERLNLAEIFKVIRGEKNA